MLHTVHMWPYWGAVSIVYSTRLVGNCRPMISRLNFFILTENLTFNSPFHYFSAIPSKKLLGACQFIMEHFNMCSNWIKYWPDEIWLLQHSVDLAIWGYFPLWKFVFHHGSSLSRITTNLVSYDITLLIYWVLLLQLYQEHVSPTENISKCMFYRT